MDLSQFNLAELRQLQDQVAKQISRREKQEREAAIEEIFRIAHSINMPLGSLLKLAPKTTSPIIVNYRDPNNPENKWSGRGPRPAWLKTAIANGATLESFRV